MSNRNGDQTNTEMKTVGNLVYLQIIYMLLKLNY